MNRFTYLSIYFVVNGGRLPRVAFNRIY